MSTDGSGPTVAILGAGVAGLCMAIRLRQAGIRSFTIFEKSDRVGGTWLDNSYPGAGCDVPSHLYSFSFEPNPDWSRRFSEQPEIHRYLEHCAEKYDILAHVRFRTEISEARFDEGAGLWHLRTRAGETVTAQVVVSGTGQLNRPHVPELPGFEDFAGPSFHSARWNHDLALAGRRVAVVGNGASAIQFVPRIAAEAERVTILQRTANWVIPRRDRAYTEREKEFFRRHPALLRLYRWAIWAVLEARFLGFFRNSPASPLLERGARRYLQQVIADPVLRRKLEPDYPAGCKRILISDDYYQSLLRPNVEVVTEPIERLVADGVRTADGRHHAADVVVFATGFETTSFLAPIDITGRRGLRLADAWADGAEAYLGVATAGFPNLFLLYGPNTNLGHNSIIFMIECQVGYVLQCIEAMRQRRIPWLEVRAEAMARYNRELQEELRNTAWAAGCTSWYKTASGKITNNWSGFTFQYWWRTRRPNLAAFDTP